MALLSDLHAVDVDLYLDQQGIDTTTPAGKALFQMMGVFAEFEREIIRERIKAGLARAKAQGKRVEGLLADHIVEVMDKVGRDERALRYFRKAASEETTFSEIEAFLKKHPKRNNEQVELFAKRLKNNQSIR